MRGAGWAFDAVYTPVETQLLRNAAAAGGTVIRSRMLIPLLVMLTDSERLTEKEGG
jgi:hypothetical protein